jgi:hypothetical protein
MLASIGILVCLAAPALAGEVHEGDVVLEVRHGRIITGLGEGADFRRAQVFGSELGAKGFPNTTDEPGFDNEPGTFDADSSLGFNLLAELTVWDGAGLASTASEIMEVAVGPESVTTGDGFVPGFLLPVADDGSWHQHYEFTLLDSMRGLMDGVYVLPMQLFSTDAGVDRSIPFWIVFNQNADEATHDAVIDWVSANVVPAPGAAAAVTAFVCLAGRRRRSP